MEVIIEKIEDEEIPFEKLDEFTSYADAIMGTSSVLGLEGISTFYQLTKSISKHVMLYDQQDLRNVVVAVVGDATSFLANLMDEVREDDESSLKNIGKEGFIKRLHWISEKFKLTGSDTEALESEEVLSQTSIDELFESLSA
jgi:hypothetical protein